MAMQQPGHVAGDRKGINWPQSQPSVSLPDTSGDRRDGLRQLVAPAFPMGFSWRTNLTRATHVRRFVLRRRKRNVRKMGLRNIFKYLFYLNHVTFLLNSASISVWLNTRFTNHSLHSTVKTELKCFRYARNKVPMQNHLPGVPILYFCCQSCGIKKQLLEKLAITLWIH